MTEVILRLDKFATNLTPFVLSLVLIMLSAMPIYLPTVGPVAPNLGLIAVFYWTIYRPELLPSFAVLPLGLWQDLLVGAPIGPNAFALLVAHGVITFQRTFFQGKSFVVVWWAFGLTAGFASFVFWAATMGYYLSYVDPMPLIFQFALTLAAFPFLCWILSKIHHAILRHA